MSFATTENGILCVKAQKKIGVFTLYGQRVYGIHCYGLGNERSAIYQLRHCKDGIRTIKMKFYKPYNPQSVSQQANRSKFAAAVAAWQSLTTEQKAVYNARAVGEHKTGNNIFISEYMSS